jgi:hypothetical protein
MKTTVPSGVSIILCGARHSHDGGIAMTRSETNAGAPVVDLTSEEYDAFLEREVGRAAGMTAAEFVRSYSAGELDDTDPVVDDLVGLLRIGQNGHRAAA